MIGMRHAANRQRPPLESTEIDFNGFIKDCNDFDGPNNNSDLGTASLPDLRAGASASDEEMVVAEIRQNISGGADYDDKALANAISDFKNKQSQEYSIDRNERAIQRSMVSDRGDLSYEPSYRSRVGRGRRNMRY